MEGMSSPEPPAPSPAPPVRIAALGDLHCSKASQGAFQPVFAQAAQAADVLVLCGDLTDYGLPEEVQILLSELKAAERLPVVAVLGNHDYESGKQEEVSKMLIDAGVHLLDGEGVEVHGVGFAGVKGFVGGFGKHSLQAWGEPSLKQLVREASDEALKLERALSRLRTSKRVAVLHYSPVRATVEDEPADIMPFLGSSRLEEPLNRYAVAAAFHGHAHHGKPLGATSAGVPVYNVALSLMKSTNADGRPFQLVTL
jgi:Icc-related predicted phosphoesterase